MGFVPAGGADVPKCDAAYKVEGTADDIFSATSGDARPCC